MRFIFLLLCLTAGGWGANHALLIGVGKYQIPYFDGPAGEAPTALPGIDRDLALMRETVARLGYKPEDVTVLSNEQASLQAIRREMGRLAEQAGRNDRVLIYYSGHGAQVPDRAPLDEEDGEDEAIVPWDFRPGRETLENVLVDDEMATLLGRIRAENVLVIFDSCHSGTADRRMVLGTAKGGGAPAWRNKRLPTQWKVKSSPGGTERTGMAEGSHLALMAAREDETASATAQGSILTLAVHAAVEQSTRQHAPVSATELLAVAETVAERFAANLAKQGETVSQHPQLRGPEEKRSLNLRQVDDAFAMVSEWAESVPDKLQLQTRKSTFRPGETLEILLANVPIAGYLNLIQVGSRTQIIRVLFPNNYSKRGNQTVAGESIALPAPDGGFELPASLADGVENERVVLVAVISAEPKDWHTASEEDRRSAFRQLAQREERDFTVAPRSAAPAKADLFVGKLIVEVVR